MSLRRCVGRARARQRTGRSGAPQVLVSTAHGHKSDGEEEVSGHAPLIAVGGSSLWFRASLSRGGDLLSNARDRVEAGRNKHTPLASEVISFSHEFCVCFFSPPKSKEAPTDHRSYAALIPSSPVHGGNLGSIFTSNNPEKNFRENKHLKHLDVRFFKYRDYVKSGKIRVKFIGTKNNVSGFFTKALLCSDFLKFRAL